MAPIPILQISFFAFQDAPSSKTTGFYFFFFFQGYVGQEPLSGAASLCCAIHSRSSLGLAPRQGHSGRSFIHFGLVGAPTRPLWCRTSCALVRVASAAWGSPPSPTLRAPSRCFCWEIRPFSRPLDRAPNVWEHPSRAAYDLFQSLQQKFW